jgi:hypothetical protein
MSILVTRFNPSPIAPGNFGTVLAPIVRNHDFSFENISSIGFKSGLDPGNTATVAPARFTHAITAGF